MSDKMEYLDSIITDEKEEGKLQNTSIFTGEDEVFASKRSISRLLQMQTEEYWNNCTEFRGL